MRMAPPSLRPALAAALLVLASAGLACGGEDGAPARGLPDFPEDSPTSEPAGPTAIAAITGVWDGTIELTTANAPSPFCLELASGPGGAVEAAVYLSGERLGIMTGSLDAHGLLRLSNETARMSLEARLAGDTATGSWGIAGAESVPNSGQFSAALREGASC